MKEAGGLIVKVMGTQLLARGGFWLLLISSSLRMTIVGYEPDAYEASWNKKDVILYALGVGAGEDDLKFIYENHTG